MSRRDDIEAKLTEALSPVHLEVTNESYKHNVPPASEMHFRVVVVSAAFEGKPQVARHREIYRTLDAELKAKKIHALSLQAMTPAEWDSSQTARQTPPCLGGEKKK